MTLFIEFTKKDITEVLIEFLSFRGVTSFDGDYNTYQVIEGNKLWHLNDQIVIFKRSLWLQWVE